MYRTGEQLPWPKASQPLYPRRNILDQLTRYEVLYRLYDSVHETLLSYKLIGSPKWLVIERDGDSRGRRCGIDSASAGLRGVQGSATSESQTDRQVAKGTGGTREGAVVS